MDAMGITKIMKEKYQVDIRKRLRRDTLQQNRHRHQEGSAGTLQQVDQHREVKAQVSHT